MQQLVHWPVAAFFFRLGLVFGKCSPLSREVACVLAVSLKTATPFMVDFGPARTKPT